MNVIHASLGDIPPLDRPRLTLGTFDGVHRGHQRVFAALRDWAAQSGVEAVVVTFDRRPRNTLLGAEPEHIVSLRHRLLLLERSGVDTAVVLRFDERLAACEPEDFVSDTLVARMRVGGVLLGHDTRFGHKGRGDFRLMRQMGARLGFETRSVRVVLEGGQPVSSTRVRAAILSGELGPAERLLGRPFSTLGRVVRGTGRGRGFGFPTANVDLHDEVRLPEGVYATRTGFDGQWHDSVTNIGRPPRLAPGGSPYLSEDAVVETHLFDFAGDLYDREIEVVFLRRLRPEREFASSDALTAAISDDVRAAHEALAALPSRMEPIV